MSDRNLGVTPDRFIDDVLTNPNVRAILDRWDALALPDGWLVAGCLFQSVWNQLQGAPVTAGIKDYDLFYFDTTDLTEAAETEVQRRVSTVLADLDIAVEAKNQARVHLWYEAYFGHPYPRLAHARAGIDRFLVLATCVGIRPAEIYAPHGLTMLYDGVLLPNPLTDHPELFHAKADSYRRRWPWLRIGRDP